MSSTSIYESLKVLPYIYICKHKETNKFYIGSRCANKISSHLDFPNYKTSSKDVKPHFSEFEWFIFAEFFNADDAYDFEQQLIFENWENPLLINKVCYHGKQRFRSIKKNKPPKIKITSEERSARNVAMWACKEYRNKVSYSMKHRWELLTETERNKRISKIREVAATKENRDHLSKSIKEKQWSGSKGDKRKQAFKELFSGANNPAAKTYKILYPDGTFDIITGGLKKFCDNLGIIYNTVRCHINKGVIRQTNIKDTSFSHSKTKQKILGWEIIELC